MIRNILLLVSFLFIANASSDTNHVTMYKAIEKAINVSSESKRCVGADISLQQSPIHSVSDGGVVTPGQVHPGCESKKTLMAALNLGGRDKTVDGVEYYAYRTADNVGDVDLALSETWVHFFANETWWFAVFPGRYQVVLNQFSSDCDNWEITTMGNSIKGILSDSNMKRTFDITIDIYGIEKAEFKHNGCDLNAFALAIYRL